MQRNKSWNTIIMDFVWPCLQLERQINDRGVGRCIKVFQHIFQGSMLVGLNKSKFKSFECHKQNDVHAIPKSGLLRL